MVTSLPDNLVETSREGTFMNTPARIFGAALIAFAAPALANSFINGGFETTTNGGGQLGHNTDATGWTTIGYNFLYTPGSADTTGVVGQYGPNLLWGPNDGAPNGLPATSPSGGNFVAADGAFQTAPIEQVITGLTIGKTYTVGFDYGFAQQEGFSGETVQNWTVSFAGQSATTTTDVLHDYTLPSHDFSGWMHTSYNFVANHATETLSFLAFGSQPVPPFALLDGVTFTPDTVPEPASWALMLIGFGGMGLAIRRRRAKAAIAA
jgi:hypothetical protein